MTVFSRLLPSLTSAYALQIMFALVFVPQQNETYFDLGGSLGFLSTAYISLYYPALKTKFWDGIPTQLPPLSSFAPRQVILSAIVGIWASRMGIFLASRAIKAGGDSRFSEIKRKPAVFSCYWFGQASWVFLTGLPVYLCNTLPSNLHPALRLRDYAALGLIAGSFLFEVIADYQKSSWRHKKNHKQHDEKFITSGLWSISRHPNYVGELGIWTGIWALSSSALRTPYFPSGTVLLAGLSPAMTYFLLRKLSGVPPLERQAEKRWGDDPKWKEYKKSVPVFWPWYRED